jgi:hypothetical protein
VGVAERAAGKKEESKGRGEQVTHALTHSFTFTSLVTNLPSYLPPIDSVGQVFFFLSSLWSAHVGPDVREYAR